MKNLIIPKAEKIAKNRHFSTSEHQHIFTLITYYRSLITFFSLLFAVPSFGQQPFISIPVNLWIKGLKICFQ